MNKKKTSPKQMSVKRREKIIRQTAGIWKDRKDLDEFFRELRKSMDRKFEHWNK